MHAGSPKKTAMLKIFLNLPLFAPSGLIGGNPRHRIGRIGTSLCGQLGGLYQKANVTSVDQMVQILLVGIVCGMKEKKPSSRLGLMPHIRNH